MDEKKFSYKEAGVDIEAGDEFVEKIKLISKGLPSKWVLSGIGGFSALVKVPQGVKSPVLVSSTDGVGTKLKIAFAANKHDTVGIDLVAMCVNDVITTGATPLFFLDYFATGRLDMNIARKVMEGIVEGCRQAGCCLVGGETAEMPDMYQLNEYDLAGFAVGIVEEDEILTGNEVKPGDVAIGFPSTGLHSNGFTLVRKLLLERLKMPLDAYVEELGCPLYEELLRPTMIYTKHVEILKKTQGVKSLAHITGGGLPGNSARNLPEEVSILFHFRSWPVKPIFHLIERCGVERSEMIKTFNMGLGMVAVISQEKLDICTEKLKENGIEFFIVGEIIKRRTKEEEVIVEP